MKNKFLWTASFISVLIIFHICYGLNTLNPTNISWLMTPLEDWGTHYLGFYFFQTEPWHFPLGEIKNYYHPLGTNVGFTDSIPLFAIFFKIFAFLLPEDFQYFGIWILLCHLLTAYYTIKICRLFKLNHLTCLIAVILISANPVLLYRVLHPALCSHWLFLGSIYLYLLPKTTNTRYILRYQLMLLLLSSAINPYMCLMVLGFTIIIAYKLCFIEKRIKVKRFLIYQIASLFGIMLVWTIIGLVNFKGEDLAVTGAYGLYSLNLNSLFNPDVFSSFLPQLKRVSWHQYEGYMYMGVGMFILTTIALIYSLKRLIEKRIQKESIKVNGINILPLLILVFIFTIFAITHIISYNDRILAKFPIPDSLVKFGEIFRASSRFFWIPYYLILFYTIIQIGRLNWNKYLVNGLLIAATAIQFYDIKLLLTHNHLSKGSYDTPLDDKNWMKLISAFDEIVFFPPFESHQLTQMDYQFFSFFAAKARKPINIGYVARADTKAMKAYSDSLTKDLENGKISDKILYITTYPHLERFSVGLQNNNLELNVLDNYYFIYAKNLPKPEVLQLGADLNSKNKSMLDSGIRKAATRTKFNAIKLIEGNENKTINFYLARFNNAENYIALEGFAFLDTTQNNQGDSIFVTMTSDSLSFYSPAKIKLRPDVTTHFKRKFLDHSGFEVLSFFDGIPKGKYKVGLGIKKSNGNFFFQSTDHIARVGVSEYNLAAKVSSLPSAGKIQHGLDHLNTDGQWIEASGWAALLGQDVGRNKIFLFLQNEKNIYLTSTDPQKRPDVTTAFNNKFKLDDSGFYVKFSKANIEKGKYKLGILIRDPVSGKENIHYTDKEIEL